MITIHNTETGEITERAMNAAELAQLEIDKASNAARLAAETQAATAKASRDAKLAKMGFTLAEIENW